MNFDDFRADHWYDTLNLQMKLNGPDRPIKSMVGGVYSRANANRVLTNEIEEIVGRLSDFSGWYRSWAKNAEARERIAEEALRRGQKITAREAWVQAAYLYFYGQLYVRSNEQEIAEGNLRMVECYARAAPLLSPPAERVEIPYRGTTMPAYFRTPGGQSGAPCLLMLGGADTVKEECHHWSEHLLARGVATLTLDGPGQGETHARLPMSADYEKAVSTAREWVQQRTEVDPNRVGLWGCSTGGYLAARTLAQDPNFKLGVSVGGFYDARNFPHWSPTTQGAFRRLYWLKSLTETIEYACENITLSGHMSKLVRPFLIVHGALDHLVPREEIVQMAEEAPGKAELWIYEDGSHAVWNRLDIAAPRTADWIAEHL